MWWYGKRRCFSWDLGNFWCLQAKFWASTFFLRQHGSWIMFRIAICSRQLCCQHLGHHCHTPWSSRPAPTTRYAYDHSCGPLYPFWVATMEPAKNEAFRSLNVLPLKKRVWKGWFTVRTLKNFVNIFVLKSETLEIPTVVVFCFS